MRTAYSVVAVIGAACLLIVGGFAVQGGAGEAGGIPRDMASSPEVQPMQYDGSTGTDYSACQQDCRSRFGIDPYAVVQFRGGGGGSYRGYYAYAACIQQCTKDHWKRYDKEMDDLEKGR
jgi:hypothetical protein